VSDKCENVLCAVNWLGPENTCVGIDYETFHGAPIFKFVRPGATRSEPGIFCKKHTVVGLLMLLKEKGADV
jgi:hypothetical protein